jgi:hypothetical protein
MKNLKVQTAPNPNGFQFKPSQFRCLARAMQQNSVRQHEFATFLRLLSSRFAPGSNEHRILLWASRTARCKEAKLRQMLLNLGCNARKPQRRKLRFIFWSKLTQSVPIPLVILLLTSFTAKPVRGRLLDPFYPWKSAQHVSGWNDSTTANSRRRAWHYLT